MTFSQISLRPIEDLDFGPTASLDSSPHLPQCFGVVAAEPLADLHCRQFDGNYIGGWPWPFKNGPKLPESRRTAHFQSFVSFLEGRICIEAFVTWTVLLLATLGYSLVSTRAWLFTCIMSDYLAKADHRLPESKTIP